MAASNKSRTNADYHRDVPGHLIRCVRQITSAIFLEEMSKFGVTSVQFALLNAIRHNAGVDQRTLVEIAMVDRSTIGTTLSRMEKAGLAFRASPKRDQRIKQVFITPRGEQLLEETAEAIERVQRRILEPLDPEEQAQFMRLMQKLIEGNRKVSRIPMRAKPPKDLRRAG